MTRNYRQLALIGGRLTLFLTVITNLIWALYPADWSAIDFKLLTISLFAFLGWGGLEIRQFYENFQPYEHPNDIKFAKNILNRFSPMVLDFLEGWDYGASFDPERLDEIRLLGSFNDSKIRYFHNYALEKKLREASNLSAELVNLIGRRGHHLNHGGYSMLDCQENEARRYQLNLVEDTESRIREAINLSSEAAAKIKELLNLILEFLPSAYTELSSNETK